MSKSKSTRSTKVKEDPDAPTKSSKTVPAALRKIFYISQRMLEDDLTEKLNLERFYHPGKGKQTLFITKDDKHIMEILEFNEALEDNAAAINCRWAKDLEEGIVISP